ncbi:pectinesterase [Stachybotrys elegans]|uniref:pectinesterase n=1 Tax=Stachybotrys elegans TaxID=80388 RepID=A0A8K0SP41_9HYPO|nr:pectinesterase [Stachybotrys elegans]
MLRKSLVLLLGLSGSSAVAGNLECRAQPPQPSSSETPSAASTTSASVSAQLLDAIVNDGVIASTPSTFPVVTTTTATTAASISTTSANVAVTVAADGSGQYSNVNSAISYAQANNIPTVTIKAGTYTETISIQATAAVTIVGETGSTGEDYSGNLVTLSNGGGNAPVVEFFTSASKGVTWQSVNFINSNPSSSAGVIFLRGSRNAFYSCQITAAGEVAFTGSYATGIIASSYIEAFSKVIYGYASLYIYDSTITATNNNALLVYNQGGADGTGKLFNSTIVFDACQVSRKSGATNKNVFIAAANGDGSVVVLKDTSIADLIAATGVYVDAKTQGPSNSYIEFDTTGPGCYEKNAAARAPYVSLVTDSAKLAPYDISSFFTTAHSSVAVADVAWIDDSVLSSIEEEKLGSSTSTTSLPSTLPESSVVSSVSTADTTTTSTEDVTSTTAAATTTTAAACYPSSVPSTALIVGPSGSCATYNSIADAVAVLPNDATSQYIYILAGTYNEKIKIERVGITIVRGESDDTMSSSSNKVTIENSSGVLSSAGGSSGTATFSATKYEAKLVSFYNINFVNSYPAAANTVAIAAYSKGTKVAFYGCNVKSSQGTLYLDYGNFFFSGGRIEGTTDFVWGIGAGYFYNSVIVSTSSSTGQTIAAQRYQGQYGGSRLVFDGCAVVPSSNAVPQQGDYLGRDYSANAQVAFINSYLDAHIAPAGWLIGNAASFTGTFAEANNTGPGYTPARRPSAVTILTDTSMYSAKNVLGDDSWLDSAAIAPLQVWSDSVYSASTTTSATQSATATATSASNVFTVAPTPAAGEYGSVSSAVAALPADGKECTIFIKAGSYEEQVSITRAGKVTLRGETDFANDFTQNKVLIKFSRGVSTSLGQNEQTPVMNWKNTAGDGLDLYNLNFTNTYPQTSNTAALAADFFGTKMAAYGCAFSGFQDTLLVNQGVQVFSNCYVDGSVDFIWGYSKAYFHQCYIASNTAGAYITAQNRPNPSWAGGFVFDRSVITYTPSLTTYGTTYLGRPWSQYAITVYMNSFLDKHIAPEGWAVWQTSNPQTSNVLFGEYKNIGPGNWTNSRASFASQLTDAQASQYSLASFIGDATWLNNTAYDLVPSYSLTQSANPSDSNPAPILSHPTSGTEPPEGAVLVAADGSISGAHTSLTAALASLPKDASAQIVFMYPGTYNEQVPTVNRPGPIMIIGYTSDAPGKSYKTNQVTITQSRGLSVSPLPAGHSNAETATIATASSRISWYNINLVNSDNLDGAKPSYVTLAASIYGDKIAFYGCSFIGWQDTLLTGATAGSQYYESCYIDGAIDFIWGYSKAYFKGCTIAAKRAKSAITAHSRASLSAIGGYIFDQCLFTEAETATVDLTGQVYLGRPYSKYALVVIKNSFLSDIIQPAGWKTWSATDPRTDFITFAEYNNSGPGNWENNAAARQAFQNATLLTSDSYPLASVMPSTDWIDMTHWDQIETPQPPPPPPPAPYDGTKPPAGAFIVSKNPIDGLTTYDTIQAALNALPVSSKALGMIFIYPGVYDEQLIISKSGTTMLLGYSASPDDYSQNQVTINFNKGIDTQADASNSDSATVYAIGNYLQAVNINFANTFGTTLNYASVGFAVRSSKYASLYGCQVYGNQDSLLINGYFFASNSYIEGNIDMIWGSGAGYFLNSTISPNRDGIAITASKRSTNTTAAGFVFDQCTITPAKGASYNSVSLGRPWNANARVAYIDSYLDSCIEPSGWDQWTKSDPRTQGVMFGEFANDGPGAGSAYRAPFATQLTADTAAQFQLANFFSLTSWINMTLVPATPFNAGAVVIPTTTTTPVSTITTYFTQVTTLKQTEITTFQAPDTTSTIKTTFTIDAATTFTPPPTTRTTVIKSTTTSVATVEEPDATTTVKARVTVDIGTTITPDAVTETSTEELTSTITSVVTKEADTTTIKSTVFTTSWHTVAPKATTATEVVRSTESFTVTSTPKPVTLKLATTITVGDDKATTVTAKALTTTSTVFVTSTKVVKKTTTLACLPTKGPSRRSLDELYLEERAIGDVTVTVTVLSTLSTFIKTSTLTLPGSTATTELISTKTIGKPTTLKPETVFETALSVQTRYSTLTHSGSTLTTTATEVVSSGKTEVLKPSTVQVVVTSVKTTVAKSTVQPPDVTETVITTKTVKSTTTLPQVKQTVTHLEGVEVTKLVVLPVSTSTTWNTVRSTLKPSATVLIRSTVTKTKTSKISAMVTSWVTKTSKGAKACTAS